MGEILVYFSDYLSSHLSFLFFFFLLQTNILLAHSKYLGNFCFSLHFYMLHFDLLDMLRS